MPMVFFIFIFRLFITMNLSFSNMVVVIPDDKNSVVVFTGKECCPTVVPFYSTAHRLLGYYLTTDTNPTYIYSRQCIETTGTDWPQARLFLHKANVLKAFEKVSLQQMHKKLYQENLHAAGIFPELNQCPFYSQSTAVGFSTARAKKRTSIYDDDGNYIEPAKKLTSMQPTMSTEDWAEITRKYIQSLEDGTATIVGGATARDMAGNYQPKFLARMGFMLVLLSLPYQKNVNDVKPFLHNETVTMLIKKEFNAYCRAHNNYAEGFAIVREQDLVDTFVPANSLLNEEHVLFMRNKERSEDTDTTATNFVQIGIEHLHLIRNMNKAENAYCQYPLKNGYCYVPVKDFQKYAFRLFRRRWIDFAERLYMTVDWDLLTTFLVDFFSGEVHPAFRVLQGGKPRVKALKDITIDKLLPTMHPKAPSCLQQIFFPKGDTRNFVRLDVTRIAHSMGWTFEELSSHLPPFVTALNRAEIKRNFPSVEKKNDYVNCTYVRNVMKKCPYAKTTFKKCCGEQVDVGDMEDMTPMLSFYHRLRSQ